jgi:glycosyltransferase involved in cell wall biosynthesis
VSKIRLVPGGADIERFRPAADKAQIRRELGIAPDRRVLFTVRRLAPRMGLDNLIAAMPAVAAKFPNALLLIGGKGPEASKLTNLIASLNIGTHVKLLGFIPDELLAGYFQAADLFVLPTTALEGFGLVTVEALAAGVPVVGTPVGATPEILSELDRRLIATGTGPDSLADAICRFFDTTRPQELAPERLHQFVRDRFTWDKHVRGVEALYAEAVDH